MFDRYDLSFDARRILFGYRRPKREGFRIYEIGVDGGGLRQVTSGQYSDVDPVYLPDERIIFGSTRFFQGVPCVGGADAVANLFLLDEKKNWLGQRDYRYDDGDGLKQTVTGLRQISRENTQRYVSVQCNVRGRDVGTFVQEAQAAVGAANILPPGYRIDWGGQFELQQAANRRLSIVIPVTLLAGMVLGFIISTWVK